MLSPKNTLRVLLSSAIAVSLFQPARTFLPSTFLPPSYLDTLLPVLLQNNGFRSSPLHSSSSSLGKDADEEKKFDTIDDEKYSRPPIFFDDECYDICEDLDNEDYNDNGSNSLPHYAKMRPSIPQKEKKEQSSSSSATTNDEKWARQMLNLRWSLMQAVEECDVTNLVTCGAQCRACQGEGNVECNFCGGTSFLTVGDKLYTGGQKCPCCNEEGEVLCPDCKGSGWVATWRNDMNLTSLGP